MPLLYGPDGKLIVYSHPTPTFEPFKVTRQLRRAYLRQCGIAHINRHFGLEPRKVRRVLGIALAKNPKFISDVRAATGAW